MIILLGSALIFIIPVITLIGVALVKEVGGDPYWHVIYLPYANIPIITPLFWILLNGQVSFNVIAVQSLFWATYIPGFIWLLQQPEPEPLPRPKTRR